MFEPLFNKYLLVENLQNKIVSVRQAWGTVLYLHFLIYTLQQPNEVHGIIMLVLQMWWEQKTEAKKD